MSGLGYNGDLSLYSSDCLKYQIFSNSSDANDYVIKFDKIHKIMYFIPKMPSQFPVDSDLYDKIYSSLSVDLYPLLTLIRTPMMVVSVNGGDIRDDRAFAYPYYLGTAKRIVCSFKKLNSLINGTNLPIMRGLSWDFMKQPHCLIVGTTGSGKSYACILLMEMIRNIYGSRVVVIDPKMSLESRFCRDYGNMEAILPNFKNGGGIDDEFLEVINRKLSFIEQLMYRRQYYLYNNLDSISGSYDKDPVFIVCSEIASLTSAGDVSRKLKNEFLGHLERICLLGRESNVHLIINTQRATSDVISVQIRENMQFKLLLGSCSISDVRLLFGADLASSMPFEPYSRGNGVGLCSFNDNKILPIKIPTIKGE